MSKGDDGPYFVILDKSEVIWYRYPLYILFLFLNNVVFVGDISWFITLAGYGALAGWVSEERSKHFKIRNT